MQTTALPAKTSKHTEKVAKERAGSTSKTLRLQGGDNLVEANFGGVKRQLRRRNALNNPRHPGAHFLASAWLLHSPGLKGVGAGVARWLRHVVDREDPTTAWRFRTPREKDRAKPVRAGRTSKAKATAKGQAKAHAKSKAKRRRA